MNATKMAEKWIDVRGYDPDEGTRCWITDGVKVECALWTEGRFVGAAVDLDISDDEGFEVYWPVIAWIKAEPPAPPEGGVL